MKNINFKSILILTMIALAFFSCQKEEDISTPTNNERFKVPYLNDAKSHFETNNKIPILDGSNNIEFRTGAATMTIKWDESSTKKYKDETDTSPQQVDILYTPITLNTQGNAKMFLASIDDNGTVDSKYVFIIYTIPENPRLFSGYVFIYDLDGNQENMLKYEEGIIVSTASNSNMAQRNDGDGGGGFTMGELLDFIGGDWFGLDGYIENDLVEVYWPEFADVDDFGGGPIDDSPWFNPINIPVGNNSGGSGGNGNTGNGYDPDDIVWWQPLTIFAHGLSISNTIEVDLDSIEANWLMNTATQEQLDAIANYLNNADQTEADGYNQGDIDFVIDVINNLINTSSSIYDESNYPGKDDGLPFEWWLDMDFVENNINFNFAAEGFGNLTAEEKALVILFPAQALMIKNNVTPVNSETFSRFGFNLRNEKSDAFIHAFFNAMNANEVGSYFAELFSNAHESEVPVNLQLEVEMDFHNNAAGNLVGTTSSSSITVSVLSNLIYQLLLDGHLVYLNPLDAVVFPNFGINTLTQLTPTNL